MKHDDWARRLRDRLADHTSEPPEGLWEDIMSSMDNRRRRTKIVRMRMWSAAAAVAALVVAGIGYYADRTAGSDTYLGGQGMTQVHGVSGGYGHGTSRGNEAQWRRMAEEAGRGQSLTASLAEQGDDTRKTGHVGVEDIRDAVSATTADNATPRDNVVAAVPDEPVVESGDTDGEVKEKPVGNDVGRPSGHEGRTVAVAARGSYGRHGSSGDTQWSVGVHSAGGFGNSNTASGVAPANNIMASFGAPENALRSEAMPLANHKEKKKHYQPVSFGLSVGYGINDRVSLVSGLVYTKASSDFTRISGNTRVEDSQTLHYIGVPLNVSYKVWRTSRFKAYVTAGGQVDFNVSAKVETDGVKADMGKDKVQWSVGASAGAEYDFVPQLGVYVEPGVKYYIDNGSRIENVFKNRQCSFSLQVGLRYNIK